MDATSRFHTLSLQGLTETMTPQSARTKSQTTENGLLAAWKTNNRVTEFFFEHLPDEVWNGKIPGAPRRTVRMIAGHIHNARCMWIKMIGRPYRIKPPKSVDRRRVTRTQLLRALKLINKGMIRLLKTGLHHGGTFTSNIPWANIPLMWST